MKSSSQNILREADRLSRPVRLTFRDGQSAEVRVRDVDWETHRTLTYQDLDNACGMFVVSLDDIEDVRSVEWDGTDS